MDSVSPIRALLFDLGRVLVDIDFGRALARWQPVSALSAQDLRAAFQHDEPYTRHETGHLDEAAYFRHLRHVLALDCEDVALRAGWNAIFVREIEPTMRLIDAVRGSVPCHVLSNTNATHLAEIERAYPALLPRFERVFTSHTIGLRKPDPAAFRHVLAELALAPEQLLFFDDLAENIEAARGVGLHAVQVTGPHDVRDALLRHGLLPPGAA
jgi:FMN phosphatase YigB (HAD superfamily)